MAKTHLSSKYAKLSWMLRKQFNGRRWDGGAVVAVSVDRNEGPMVGVARRLDLQLPVLWDHDGAWVRELDPPALPMSYLVVGGRIARVHAGAMDAGALDAFVSDVGR